MKNIKKVRFRRTEGSKNRSEENRNNEHSHYNHLFLGMSLAAICFMLLFTGIGMASASITGDSPNPTGDTIIDQDTVWDGESNIYCGGNIRVGNLSKRIYFDIKNSHVKVKGKWTMGGNNSVNFRLLGSTIFFDVKSGEEALRPGGTYVNTNQMMVVEDTSDLSKPSRIDLKNSTIRGTDYTYRGGGVSVRSGGGNAEHTLIVDNVKFSYMGGATKKEGRGYPALNTGSSLASDSRLTKLDFYYCGWGISLVCQDNIVLNGATSEKGYVTFFGGKRLTNLHMDESCEGLYNPCDGALIDNSWFDSYYCKFNIMSASNVIFEHNTVHRSAFNAGDGSWAHQGNNNTIRHCELIDTTISSRKEGTKIIHNTFTRANSHGGNVAIRAWGGNFLIEDNTFTEGGTAISLKPHPWYNRRGGHIIRGNTIKNTAQGMLIEKQNNVKIINNIIDGTATMAGISLKNSADLFFRDNSISNTATYDIYFKGDNNNVKFINTKFDEAKVSFSDASDKFFNYYYLDVKVVDSNGNPVSGATVTITNNVDSKYPSINANGETKTSFTTGTDGHIPLPSDSKNSIAMLDYWQTKNRKKGMRYTITAKKDGYSNSITVNPDSSWYRSDPNTWQNTVTIVLETGLDATPPTITAHSPTGSNVPKDTEISVTFSEAMNKASAESAFSISPSVIGPLSWDGNKMIFTPDSDLSYETTYIVTIGTGAEDLAGNNLASPYSWQFTTIKAPDTTSPVISNVAAGITGSSATITWTTDEAATSQVEYGLTGLSTSYGPSTTLDTNLVTSHSQTITGLTPATTYHYRVKSRNASNNLAISADYTFTTAEEEDKLPGYRRFLMKIKELLRMILRGNDGTINGATWTAGKLGSALQFGGTDGYVDAGPLWGSGDVTEWSAKFWVKLIDYILGMEELKNR